LPYFPPEIVREHQRTINRAVRELERERNHLQQSEKKIIMDIKKSAKQGQMVRKVLGAKKKTKKTIFYHLI
jgi:charged multivesicular body protein 2A